MKNILLVSLILIIAAPVLAATSANYAISAEVIDLGGVASMDSSNYHLSSKLREIAPAVSTSSSYTLEGRFTGIVYGAAVVSTFEIPTVSAIIPNQGYNDRSYRVIINGTNISTEAAAFVETRLQKAGQSSIYGSDASIESSTSMECTFGLNGAATGQWTVVVKNASGEGYLVNGFTINSPGPVKIVGTPVNDPNPFNPSEGPTHIKYKLSREATISLYLFNQRGELVWQKTYPPTQNGGLAGDNDVTWDGASDFKEDVPTGVYVLRIVSKSGGVRELGRIKIAVLR